MFQIKAVNLSEVSIYATSFWHSEPFLRKPGFAICASCKVGVNYCTYMNKN